MIKKLLQTICIILMLLLVFRGAFFRFTVSYTPTEERKLVSLTSQELIDEINAEKKKQELEEATLSLEAMVTLAKDLTNKHLKFTSGETSNNPNSALKIGKANCVGYAALFNSIFIFLVKQQGEFANYRVQHLVGTVDFWGNNINELIDHPFFKDHDFCVIENLLSKEKWCIDPSVSDYLGVDRVKVVGY